jgi:NAD(P)H dehydrogenase (quinone)
MVKVLIVYYSRTGNTEKMARHVATGVRKGGAEPIVKRVRDARIADLKRVAGVILGSPTYYGTLAAELKKFVDDSVALHGQLAGKVGGAFSSAGGPGGGSETAVLDMLKALLIHGMIVPGNVDGAHYGPTAVEAPDKLAADQCVRMGQLVAELAVKLHGGGS